MKDDPCDLEERLRRAELELAQIKVMLNERDKALQVSERATREWQLHANEYREQLRAQSDEFPTRKELIAWMAASAAVIAALVAVAMWVRPH